MIAYIGEVFKAGHPRDRRGFIPRSLKVAIEANVNLSPEEISRKRLEWFKVVDITNGGVKGPREKSQRWHVNRTETRGILKKILLLKGMLEEVGYEDYKACEGE